MTVSHVLRWGHLCGFMQLETSFLPSCLTIIRRIPKAEFGGGALQLPWTWTNFHNFVTVKFRRDLRRKLELKLHFYSPQICCHTTLWKVNGQIYSFTAVNSVQSDEKNYLWQTFTRDAISFVFLHSLIYVKCLKSLHSANVHVLSGECPIGQWMRQLCVVQCCTKCFNFITERNE